MGFFQIIFLTIFVNNYVLAQFLGICPSIGVSSKVETSMGMSAAVTFVITLASVITWALDRLILQPNLIYLRTVAFILVIAALVQIVEMFLKKSAPALYNALGIYLPLITTNCVVLGVAILNVPSNYTLLQTVASALGASLGFALALILWAAIRESFERLDNIPACMRGVPSALFTLGLMSMAFAGFAGMFQ